MLRSPFETLFSMSLWSGPAKSVGAGVGGRGDSGRKSMVNFFEGPSELIEPETHHRRQSFIQRPKDSANEHEQMAYHVRLAKVLEMIRVGPGR